MNRSTIAALMIGAAISMGALASAVSPTAHAEKINEGTIKAECKDVGGTYGTVVKQGMRFSTCRYKDISGDGWVDYYADGEYYSTRPT